MQAIHSYSQRRALASISWLMLFLMIFFYAFGSAQAASLTALEKGRIAVAFPQAGTITEPEGDFQIRQILSGDELLGYAYQTINVVDIPAYSGKPVNLQVLLDPQGVIKDAYVLKHEEPILLIGIPEQKLHDFAAKYEGIKVDQRVVIGRSKDESAITIDAVSGATVTVMVVNEAIMRSAHRVAVSLGLVAAHSQIKNKPAIVLMDEYQKASWTTLTGDGSIRRLLLNRGQVDDAFIGSEAEGIESASAEKRDDTFIDLYVAELNPPTIGRNLLGERQYQDLMDELKPDEHAIVILGNGDYSFKGSGYVRGGIFDRIQLRQFGDIISFRDLDFYRLSDVYAEGMPHFTEMGIFIIRPQYAFDSGSDWTLELLVRRQTGPVDSIFTSFELPYQIPEMYIERPPLTASEQAAIDEANRPLWLNIWYQKDFQIGVLGVGLVVLFAIMFFQDYLVRYPKVLHRVRMGYLTFTVVFIGWYALGQLSIVNVLTFAHSIMNGFSWELFLSDPIIFILWGVTAAIVLLWGRGVFCGWLCPFGALQEIINEIARKIKIPQYEVPFALHERLWAIKYLILLVLFGISLESMSAAEQYAEIEPFKTAITLRFDRQWWFVLYAVVLLVINIFTRKVYCRYICPLGAALAIPTQLRLFDWLKRRKECGTPCQLCAVECEVQAIHPDGRINANECHHCLDCQVTYFNEDRCPPLVAKKKRRERNKAAPQTQEPQIIPVVQLETPS